jgi:hypothetical protein
MPDARAPLLASLLLLAFAPRCAQAQADPGALNRCVDAEGNAVYTDRACEALDARPARTAPPNPDAVPDRVATVRECARKPTALVEAIELALAAADGNRLAELYDWRGRSRASAEAAMPRLEALAASRLLEVRALHSAEGSDDPELAAEAAEAPPDRLRITHAPDGLGTGEVAEFRLVRAAGCWLIAD